MEIKQLIKGRGAQYNPHNKFVQQERNQYFIEGIDEQLIENPKTTYLRSTAKSLVHKVESPDLHMEYSANPYQGCEHGCIYCYARNSHQYWDYGSGLDFEKKIIIKENAPLLFRKFIMQKNWDFSPIHLSGNTDCYQPIERKEKLTRKILEIALTHRQPISIITKNNLILRDIDILEKMAKLQLVKVTISITSLEEHTRQLLEPRTVTVIQRLRTIQELKNKGIPVGVNIAPIIPGLTEHELPSILSQASSYGAQWANYIIVRLNGQIGEVFYDWLEKHFPNRKDKIWNAIKNCHQGKVNNSTWGERMKGTGNESELIKQVFDLHCKKLKLNEKIFCFAQYNRNELKGEQLALF